MGGYYTCMIKMPSICPTFFWAIGAMYGDFDQLRQDNLEPDEGFGI